MKLFVNIGLLQITGYFVGFALRLSATQPNGQFSYDLAIRIG